MPYWLTVNWHELFVPTKSIMETVIRGSVTYLSLFVLLRLFRRQTGSMGPADLLVLLLIADASQNAMAGEYRSVTDGLVLVSTIVGWEYTLDYLGFHFPALGRFLEREPLPIIQDGVLNERYLKQELMTVDELVGERAAAIVPVSATTGEQVNELIDVLVDQLSPGPAFYPDGELTDEPEEVLMAELIREAALEGVRDELPHSLAVVIDEVSVRQNRSAEQGDLTDVRAILYVERPSQKGIVIGRGGARLKEVGTNARRQIETRLGTQIYLELRVKVAKDWQQDPKLLGRLGF